MKTRWVRVVGDGLVYEGPCLVHSITLWPDADVDYAYVYDGHDAISGKLFCRLEASVSTTLHLGFGDGVPFDQGIYVDGVDAGVETTIVFTPLEG